MRFVCSLFYWKGDFWRWYVEKPPHVYWRLPRTQPLHTCTIWSLFQSFWRYPSKLREVRLPELPHTSPSVDWCSRLWRTIWATWGSQTPLRYCRRSALFESGHSHRRSQTPFPSVAYRSIWLDGCLPMSKGLVDGQKEFHLCYPSSDRAWQREVRYAFYFVYPSNKIFEKYITLIYRLSNDVINFVHWRQYIVTVTLYRASTNQIKMGFWSHSFKK